MSIIEDQRLHRELTDYEFEQAYGSDPAHGVCESCGEAVCLHDRACRNQQDGVTIEELSFCLGVCACIVLHEILVETDERARRAA